ncbi:hypothetical protein GKE82_00990 [Conexibacter sp. W3-3-2]|uniref:hypothetical protein n=1 Tax=Conexibacter sp. W3-3-2 TaxID=2675227 RepID=UPI0012B7B9C8|nr:hypothetical protein [Conexibacter sp. W3-3-2]MTD42914.1 hypothetical protein [Conexibacter sp. W3-3-2]
MPSSLPAVTCLDCGFTWNSAAMADGLRLLGTCARCGTGTLAFRDAPPSAPAPQARATADHDGAPHLVLGVPRR